MKPKEPQTLELQQPPKGSTQLARADQIPHFDIEAIFKMAIDKEGTAETLERLMAIRRELNAESAQRAFNDALAQFQKECPVIKKRKAGARNAYFYAPLDDVVVQVQPLLTKHGFSFSVTSEVEKDWVKAICKVTHRDGHSERSEFKIPIDARNTMMNDPQRYAGSLTFAKRYSFCNAFGILTGDEDTDGGARPKPAGPSSLAGEGNVKALAQQLWDLLKPVRGTEKNWNAANQWLWQKEFLDGAVPEEAPNLTAQQFMEVIELVKAEMA